jgi:hypothetical protein
MKGVSGEIELWKGFDVVLESPAAIAGGELSIASFPQLIILGHSSGRISFLQIKQGRKLIISV